jgi:hypothetical protein
MSTAAIREFNKAKSYSQAYPDIHYYLTEKKLFVYYRMETTPRLSFVREEGRYVIEKRVRKASIRECIDWAVKQPEFQGLTIQSPGKTLTLF